MVTHEDITALVLAGGMARRMGGTDKGLLSFRQQPLIAPVLARVAPQADEVLINANRNQSRYEAMGYRVVSDRHSDYQGPMMGFLSGLEVIKTEWLLVVPCDSPFLPQDLASRLKQAANESEALIAVACDRDRLQPVFALIHRSLAADLATQLEVGERKIDRWYARHPQVTVDFSDQPDAFVNLNSPEDLARYEGNSTL